MTKDVIIHEIARNPGRDRAADYARGLTGELTEGLVSRMDVWRMISRRGPLVLRDG